MGESRGIIHYISRDAGMGLKVVDLVTLFRIFFSAYTDHIFLADQGSKILKVRPRRLRECWQC